MMGFSSFILYLLIDFLFSVTVNAYTIPLTTQLRKFGSDTTLKVRRSDHFAKKEIPVFNNLNTIYILDGTMLLASSYYGLKSRRNYLHSTDRGWNYSPFYDDVSMLAMEFGYYIGRDPYITGSLVIENMLLKLTSFIEHVKPLYIAVVFDSSYSFRESLSPEYKANRKKFVHQDLNMINAYNILENRLGCRCFHVNNFEADDVMASIGAWARKRNLNAIHVSNDKDMLQLIDDQTFAMHFHDLTLIGKDEVNEKYGVYPNKLVDFFTLVGDRADNIRGIEGIGRVTAKYLLWYFRTVENLYEELGLKALSMNQYPQSSSMYSTYQFNDYQRPRLPMNQWKRSLSLLSDMVYSYKVRHLIDPENVLYSLLAVDLQEVRLTQRLVKLEQNVPLPRLSSIHDLCYRGGYSFRSGN